MHSMCPVFPVTMKEMMWSVATTTTLTSSSPEKMPATSGASEANGWIKRPSQVHMQATPANT